MHLDCGSAPGCMRVHLRHGSTLKSWECSGMHESALGSWEYTGLRGIKIKLVSTL